MSEVKWIKLSTNMPDNRKVRKIRRLPDGNNIILFWVFLLSKAGESNQMGGLFFLEDMPYTIEDLADEFDFTHDFVRFALITLEKMQMVEMYDEIIYIKNWEKYQSVDQLEKMREQTRKRVAKHREKQKQLKGIEYCSYCGGLATGEDHILATARGGSEEERNKVDCCIDCNRIKNDKPLVDFLNANRDRVQDELIRDNPKLNKLVELCNVTDRYIVTEGNATDIELELDKELDIEKELIPYVEIIDYLNDVSGKKYRSTTQKTKDLIKARWNEAFTVDDFKQVIDKKVKEWTGTDMAKYIRPETLFGNKFEGYLNQEQKSSGSSIDWDDL